MQKNIIKGLIAMVVLSFITNIYLLARVDNMGKDLKKNTNRITYVENNFEEKVTELILEDKAGNNQDLLEEVKFSLSELTDKKAKKAMINVEFKLKRMDSTSKTYASIECGQEEPLLIEILPINDTTYKIEREICVLQPLRVDLVMEKYGEKKIINLVLEEDLYQNFVGKADFDLIDFDHSYTKETGKFIASFSASIAYNPVENHKLQDAYVVIEKNGMTIKYLPLEVLSEGENKENTLYGIESDVIEVFVEENNKITMAVVLEEKNSFVHRYEFMSCTFEKGEALVRFDEVPLLTLK